MLKARMLFGLNTSVNKNISCISEDEILYPIGGVIIIHNYKKKSQRYINLPNPQKEISVISVSLKGKCLAVAEKGDKGEKPRIYVYDLISFTRKTTLGIPFEINSQEFMCVAFTHDSHYLVALTAGPDFMMYYYNWKSGKIESQTKATNPPSTPGPVTDMAINPKDATIAVFVGLGLFRLVSMSENVWRQYGFQKAQNFSILSVCWLTDDRLLAGCKDGKVLIVQSGDLNGVYSMNETNQINIVTMATSKKDQLKTLSRTLSKQLSTKKLHEKKQLPDIRCCTAISTGFIYSENAGEVTYFERINKLSYKKSRTFVIKQDIMSNDVNYESLYYIKSVTTSIDETIILCTTNRSQIYWASLQKQNFDTVEFDIFEESLHHGSVSGLSTCLWKPIFMTSGHFDNSVRIWDYLTSKLLLCQTFIETVICISLHPTGLYALIGFSDNVRFLLILVHQLQVYREFGIANCQILAFSNNGHLFAAECNYDILIYSSITFHKIACFKGHYQQITSLQWSNNDLMLYSSSINGAIYEWSIEKRNRIADIVIQDVTVKGLVEVSDSKIICIGSDGTLKEIKDSKVTSNVRFNHDTVNSFDHITILKNSKCKLLLAGNNGSVILLNYPTDDKVPKYDTFLMHNRPLTKFCIMQKGPSLVTTDIDGTICIWDVKNDLENQISQNPYFTEILINISELNEKNQNLKHLACRLAEMESEHSFEIKQQESMYQERIKMLEEKYTNHIQTLKLRIKTLEKEHSMELNRIHLNITQMKQKHTSEIDQMDSNFNTKLLYEFQKYDALKQKMEIMQKEYERKIDDLQNMKHRENENRELQFQSQIKSLQQELIQLRSVFTSERKQLEETVSNLKQKVEDESNNLRNDYEAKLQERNSIISTLKMDLGITTKKLTIIQKEKEEFKSTKGLAETEYECLKQRYNDSLRQIEELKTELSNFKRYVDEEKKLEKELKEKIKGMVTLKAELETVITKLETELKEQNDQLAAERENIRKMEKRIKREENEKLQLQTEIIQLKGKLRSKETMLQESQVKSHALKVQLAAMKADICGLEDYIHNPKKLKQEVKLFRQKYNAT